MQQIFRLISISPTCFGWQIRPSSGTFFFILVWVYSLLLFGVYELDICVTVRHWYNDVSNQQNATNFSFINLFKSALYVLGDKFAHHQEHFFDCIYSFWYNAPTLLPIGATWHRSAAVSVQCTKSCICNQKVLPRMGEFVARNMWGWFKKINELKRCCISLVANIVKN